MYGWLGKVLDIDLTKGTVATVELPEAVYRTCIGGRGLAGHLLGPDCTKSWDDPAMPLLLFTGPLVGTASPTSGLMCVMSRSPLTGTVGDCSVGGTLGTAIKACGFDGIIIRGMRDAPCGIELVGEQCAITDAAHLWGAATDAVRGALEGKGASVAIGPAAEHGVRFANVIVDGRFAAGRNGLGLVFAAKKLKYITAKGDRPTPVHDPAELANAREDIFRLISASPILMGELGISNYGTGALYDLIDSRHMMPTDNFLRTHFDGARGMNAYAYRTTFDTRKAGCTGCHILCTRCARDGAVMPEFEVMSHFSALIGNRDLHTVVAANTLCNEMGMDTISAAATLACYSEISGETLTPSRVLDLLIDIGQGRGIGVDLGKGSAAYAAAAGRLDASVNVKGQELPAYDPRGAYGMAIAYATSTRGACHLRAYPISHEILRKPVVTDRFSFDGKARIIKIAEDLNAVVDSLTACTFVFLSATLEEYAHALAAVTGIAWSAQDLLLAGERIVYHERIMNARNGFCAVDDDLPRRFFEAEGTPGDGIDVPRLDREAFLKARANYYRVRGLTKDGQPTRETAERLGLTWNG